MRKLLQAILLGAIINALFLENTYAAGISVDAGLTPPEDRWIIRTQMRYMQREDDPTPMDREMDTYAFPLVVAYGLRSDFTLLVRQTFKNRKMTMAGSTDWDSGADD
ncbi:MAG: hypothetical protein ACYSR3_07815, partial [Planctomycetota bacterium]